MERNWQTIKEYTDILFEFYNGIAKISINRPKVYNAFRPLTNEEIARMGIEKVFIDLDIDPGDAIRVISGPFEGFMGEAESIDREKQVVHAKLNVFGRSTPVEIEFGQVDRI